VIIFEPHANLLFAFDIYMTTRPANNFGNNDEVKKMGIVLK